MAVAASSGSGADAIRLAQLYGRIIAPEHQFAEKLLLYFAWNGRPDREAVAWAIQFYESRGDKAGAAAFLQHLADRGFASANDRLLQAIYLNELGKSREAAQLLERLDPNLLNAALYYKTLGDAAFALGDSSRASQSYRKYLELEPNAPDKSEIESRIQSP